MKTTEIIGDLYALRELCAGNVEAATYLSTIIKWLEQKADFGEEFKKEPVRIGACSFELDFGDPFFRQFYFGYRHEAADLEFFLAACPPGGIVWDVGASAGLYAIQIAKRENPPSQVMAFEPGKRALALLKRNVQINGVENIVQVFDCALGHEDGESDFFETESSAMSGLADTGRSPISQVYPVAVRAADEVWEGQGSVPVDLMKVDVEGHEGEVLVGAQRLLAGSPNITVMFEASSKNLTPSRRAGLSAQLARFAADGWNFHLHSGSNGLEKLADFGGWGFDAANGNVYMVRAGSMAESHLDGFFENLEERDQDMIRLRKAVPAALAQIKLYTENQILEPQSRVSELMADLDKLRRHQAALEGQVEHLKATLKATEAIAHSEMSEKEEVAQKLVRRSEELAKSLKQYAELMEELKKYRR